MHIGKYKEKLIHSRLPKAFLSLEILLVLALCAGFWVATSQTINQSYKSVEINLLSGSGQIENDKQHTTLQVNQAIDFQLKQTLHLNKDSLAGIIFADGKFETVEGPAKLVFQSIHNLNSQLVFEFEDQIAKQSLKFTLQPNVLETTAMVLGYRFPRQTGILGVRENLDKTQDYEQNANPKQCLSAKAGSLDSKEVNCKINQNLN